MRGRLPVEGAFDLVGAFDVLEHIDQDEQALRELLRDGRPRRRAHSSPFRSIRSLWSPADVFGEHKPVGTRERTSTEKLGSTLASTSSTGRRRS